MRRPRACSSASFVGAVPSAPPQAVNAVRTTGASQCQPGPCGREQRFDDRIAERRPLTFQRCDRGLELLLLRHARARIASGAAAIARSAADLDLRLDLDRNVERQLEQADRAARMRADVGAEELEQQLGTAVDHRRLAIEARRRVHHPEHARPGDDAIQVRSTSVVTGGAGNDSISVTGEGTTINFANGDGNDVIDVNGHDVDFAISGYSLNDVIVTERYGQAIVNFKGSSDSLTFNLGGAGSVQLTFSDSASVDIKA